LEACEVELKIVEAELLVRHLRTPAIKALWEWVFEILVCQSGTVKGWISPVVVQVENAVHSFWVASLTIRAAYWPASCWQLCASNSARIRRRISSVLSFFLSFGLGLPINILWQVLHRACMGWPCPMFPNCRTRSCFFMASVSHGTIVLATSLRIGTASMGTLRIRTAILLALAPPFFLGMAKCFTCASDLSVLWKSKLHHYHFLLRAGFLFSGMCGGTLAPRLRCGWAGEFASDQFRSIQILSMDLS